MLTVCCSCRGLRLKCSLVSLFLSSLLSSGFPGDSFSRSRSLPGLSAIVLCRYPEAPMVWKEKGFRMLWLVFRVWWACAPAPWPEQVLLRVFLPSVGATGSPEGTGVGYFLSPVSGGPWLNSLWSDSGTQFILRVGPCWREQNLLGVFQNRSFSPPGAGTTRRFLFRLNPEEPVQLLEEKLMKGAGPQECQAPRSFSLLS